MMDTAFCSLLAMMAVQGLKGTAVTGPPSNNDALYDKLRMMVLHIIEPSGHPMYSARFELPDARAIYTTRSLSFWVNSMLTSVDRPATLRRGSDLIEIQLTS